MSNIPTQYIPVTEIDVVGLHLVNDRLKNGWKLIQVLAVQDNYITAGYHNQSHSSSDGVNHYNMQHEYAVPQQNIQFVIGKPEIVEALYGDD